MSRTVVVLPATPSLIPTSRELLVAAHRLGLPIAVLWFNGALDPHVRDELGDYGVADVYLVTLPDGVPRGVAGSRAVLALEPTWIVLRSHPDATENAALLGHELGVATVVDATGLDVDDVGVHVHKAVFGSTWLVTTRVLTGGGALAFRPNSFPTGATTAGGTPPAVHDLATPDIPGRVATVTARVAGEAPARPDLESASVVVVGGRGTDGDFSAVEALADELGGAVGATRDVTDLHWAPHETLVGQTGVTIGPALYIGGGRVRAIHHLIGMRSSGTIVAINYDPDAPLAEIADAVVVGDANTVLTELTEEIRRRRSKS